MKEEAEIERKRIEEIKEKRKKFSDEWRSNMREKSKGHEKKLKKYVWYYYYTMNNPAIGDKNRELKDLDDRFPDLVKAGLVNRGLLKVPCPKDLELPIESPEYEDIFVIPTFTSTNPFSPSGKYDQREYFKKKVLRTYQGYSNVSQKLIKSVLENLEEKENTQ